MTKDLGVWKAEDCALVLIDYQREMFEVIRSETNADMVELHARLLAMMTERPARRAVRAIACPSRPAPMIPTRLRSAGSIRFLPRARGRSAFPGRRRC